MAENEKNGTPGAPDSKGEKGKGKTEPAPAVKPLHTGYGRQRAVEPSPVAALSAATGTAPAVLAALRAAYHWTDETRVTREEFLQKRDAWLSRPATEV